VRKRWNPKGAEEKFMSELVIPAALKEYEGETSEHHRGQISKMHERDFAEHQIEEERPGIWYCAKPGTGILHFYVCFLPHAIIVYGDIGDMLIRPGRDRGLGWLRGATHEGDAKYLDYLLGKVPQSNRRRKFMPGDVVDSLREYGDDPAVQKALDEWADRLDGGEDLQEAWCNAASYADLDSEWYGCFEDYDAEMYWCGLALCWFVREWRRLHA